MSELKPSNTYNSDELEISLTELISTIWQSRWVVVVITAVIVLLASVSVLITAQYKSEGLYQFGGAIPLSLPEAPEAPEAPGISLANYRRFAASFQTPEHFEQYIHSLQLKNTPEINNLRQLFASKTGISKQIEPLYSFTQADSKILFAPKEGNNNILGLRITLQEAKPEVAQQMVALLGRYIIDSIIYDAYADKLLTDLNKITLRLSIINNRIISEEETQHALQRTQTALQTIIRKYPSAAESRIPQQVISVDRESVRYLAPTTQLVAVELKLSEIDEAIHKLKREARQLELKQEFYRKAQDLHSKLNSGEAFLVALPSALHEVFQDKDLDNNEVKEVFNSLSMENQAAENLYLARSRFVAGPTLPQHSTARLGLTVAGSALAGMFLSVIFVLGRQWWKENMGKSADK